MSNFNERTSFLFETLKRSDEEKEGKLFQNKILGDVES